MVAKYAKAHGIDLIQVIDGDDKNGTLMAGQIAGLIKEQKTCKEIIETIMLQAEGLLNK